MLCGEKLSGSWLMPRSDGQNGQFLEAPAIRSGIFDLARGAIYLSMHSMGYIYVPGSY
jgi:hypothetical protein